MTSAGPAWTAAALLLAAAAGVCGQEPYAVFASRGAEFYGPGWTSEAADTLTAVRLGLTGPTQGAAGAQLQQGVGLAVDEANAAGGYQRNETHLPYQVVFRADDGPWGVVATQVVRLSQEDQVWAIIGSLDGERAHAAELVAAKLWLPVLTPVACDLTIDYANVPWVFRLMPDDRAQADLLLRHAAAQGWTVAAATEGTRDGHQAALRVQETAAAHGHDLSLQIEFDPHDPQAAAPRLTASRADALLVWGQVDPALALIEEIRRRGDDRPVLVPASLVLPQVSSRPGLGTVLGAAPYAPSPGSPELASFRARYRQRTGEEATHVAAYAYDAARLVITAIERAGLNRVRLRAELAQRHMQGITGEVSFSSLGGCLQLPVLASASGGRWCQLPDASGARGRADARGED